MIHLPKGICGFASKESLRGKLLEIAEVPHNLNQKTIDEVYEKFKEQLSSLSQKQLLVILGGDAPDANNVQMSVLINSVPGVLMKNVPPEIYFNNL